MVLQIADKVQKHQQSLVVAPLVTLNSLCRHQVHVGLLCAFVGLVMEQIHFNADVLFEY